MREPIVEVLTEDASWKLLAAHEVARLAVDIAGHPDIFPINYVVDGATIVFRTGPGTKLAGAVLNRHVALEIDGDGDPAGGDPAGGDTVWSVVVKGDAHEIDAMEDRFAADDLPLYPWIDTPKANFVRIRPTSVTGRRFRVTRP